MAFQWRNLSLLRIAGWGLLVAALLIVGIVYAAMQESDMVRLEAKEQAAYIAEQEKLETEINQHIAQIQSETSGLKNHPWAGEYYEGDGLGANINLYVSPVAGVTTTWHGCMGLYGADFGSIRQNDEGFLEFSFRKNKKGGFDNFEAKVLPVRWGERRYLIPEKQLAKFASDINLGDEPRDVIHGRYPLLQGDEKKPVSGLPNLPAEYLQRIRTVATKADIVKVERLSEQATEYSCKRSYRVTLNKGRSDGLQPEDTLRLISPRRVFENLVLTEVQDSTASGQINTYADKCTDTDTMPDKSWVFSTGAYSLR